MLNTSSKPSALSNALASFIGMFTPFLVFLLVTPSLKKHLGAEQFGEFTLFIVAIGLIGTLDFGLSTSGIRALGNALHNEEESFHNVFSELWTISFLIAICYALIICLLHYATALPQTLSITDPWWTGLSITAFFTLCTIPFISVARAKELFLGSTLIQVVIGLLLWFGALVLVQTDSHVDTLYNWFSLVSFFGFLSQFAWTLILDRSTSIRFSSKFDYMSRYLSFGGFSFFAQLSSSATYHADKFILMHYLGSISVGNYGLASNLASKLLALSASLSSFVYPRSIRLHSQGENAQLQRTYLLATRYMLLITWPLLVTSLFLGGKFLDLWIGQSTANLIEPVFYLLSISYFLASLSVVASHIYCGIGNTRIGAIYASIGGITNVLGCIVFIPYWGLIGAGIASLLSMIQVLGYTHSLQQRIGLPMFPHSKLWVCLIAASITPCLYFLTCSAYIDRWWELCMHGFIGWLLFYIFWFRLGLVNENDKALISRIFLLNSKNVVL